MAEAQPGIFTTNQKGFGQGSITRQDQVTLADRSSPARIGETIVIYCTGLGATEAAVVAGQQAPVARIVNEAEVRIGGVKATVSYAGLSPGWAGLYQINAVVPAGITTGDEVPITITIKGQTSPEVTLAIR